MSLAVPAPAAAATTIKAGSRAKAGARARIPYLAEGVRIHGEKVSEALRPFHDRLEACFKQLREKVEKQYGAKTL
ncbi:hypothetical protein CRUP_037908, partial [Coryphaenoides rupestris]